MKNKGKIFKSALILLALSMLPVLPAYAQTTQVKAYTAQSEARQIAEAVGTALGTFVGQNVGAGDYKRVRQGVRCAYVMHFVCYGIFCPIVWLCAEPIMSMFTKSPESIGYGLEYMRIFSFFFLIGGTMCIYHNVLRASGDVKMTLAMGISEVITRITFTFLFTALMGYWGLWWVSPITWCCAVGVGAIRYYSGKWEEIARKQMVAQ